jgi:hypothetical protein
MLRFVKRRNPALRPPARPDGIILLEGGTRDWRKRVEALKAAQTGSTNAPAPRASTSAGTAGQ